MVSTLLSQALVAFTIEFDNEAEARLPHRTTRAGGSGPWLVSRAMWCTCMRWVTADGITPRELERRARTPTNLDGMRRWGYVTIEDGVLRPTRGGRRAQGVWAPLTAEIEARWAARTDVPALRAALAVHAQPGLPNCMPILRHGLRGRVVPDPEADEDVTGLSLPALLARALLGYALAYEKATEVSLAVAANALRVLQAGGTPVMDLPAVAGVSKEAIAVSLGLLERGGLAIVQAGRPRIARLTAAGVAAQHAHADRRERLDERFGDDLAGRLGAIPLQAGLDPLPGGWRRAAPAVLPHFPMVLHRGGFPDGS